jgi:hypothetical protein
VDVSLGVYVGRSAARISLLDAVPPHAVIDQSEIDLRVEPIETLASTLISTDRMLKDSGHRLVTTRLCSDDPEQASALRTALSDASLTDVADIPRSDAATAVVRKLAGGETAALLMTEGDTAALSIVDADSQSTSLIAVESIEHGDPTRAYKTLLQRFGEEPGGATSVIVVDGPEDAAATAELSAISPVPLRFPDAPGFSLAYGAALAASDVPIDRHWGQSRGASAFAGAETMMGPQGPQLAYSEVDESEDFSPVGGATPMQTPMSPLGGTYSDEVEEDEPQPAARPKALLVGSTVAAVVVVGFAVLAVSVAINIRPAVTQQAIRTQAEVLPGKYFPVSPGQGVTPDGENWTVIENLPKPGEPTDVRTFETKPLSVVRASSTSPQVFEVYRDGTVGMQAAQVPVAGVPIGVTPVGAAGVPGLADLVPRLIPDLSKISMCQVLGLLSNMQQLTSQAMSTFVEVSQIGDPTTGLTIDDIGLVTAVDRTRGELFPTTITDAADIVPPGAGVIPAEIFEPNQTAAEVAAVLPTDTTLIEAIPTDTAATGIPGGIDLSAAIPDVEALTPAPDAVLPGTTDIFESTPVLPELLPGGNTPAQIPDINAELPETLPLPEGTQQLPEIGELPELVLPDAPAGTPPDLDVPVVTPPRLELPELPVAPAPVEVPELPAAPLPQLELPDLPAAPPPVELPELPVAPAPVEVPELPAAPLPTFEMPEMPAPTFELPELPAAPAPTFELPAIPAAPVPTFEMPELPPLPSLPSGGSSETPVWPQMPSLESLFGG